MEKPVKSFKLNRYEVLFLLAVYCVSLFWRLWPKLLIDAHLLTMNADVWERLSMAQYFLDKGHLPQYCLRYIAYGNVPFWYPPLGPVFLAVLAKITALDLPTVCSRVLPFFEALTPIPFYFLARWLFGRCAGFISVLMLALTPSFIYWTGITTPISLTLFLLPIYIILLLIRREGGFTIRNRIIWIAITAVLLSLNFLTHLTYFLAILILIPVSLEIFLNTESQSIKIMDFIAALLLSQLITVFWWAPHDLYEWWIFHLTTSSGYQDATSQLKDYGVTAGIIGTVAYLLYLWKILRSMRKITFIDWLPLAWVIFPFLEVQNETILKLFGRIDLSWSTLFKPLEGFRFFCFLAQPLALITGWVFVKYIISRVKYKKAVCLAAGLILTLALSADLFYVFRINVRFQNSGITPAEYKAAVWFRNHSSNDDRIIADYYRSQILAGVSGGKALLGGLFPLRNANIPYVSVPAVVQDDLCAIYTTPDPKLAVNLMRKYHSNCIFISPLLLSTGYLGSDQCKGFGIKADLKKYEDKKYFEEFYNDKLGVRIIKIRKEG